MMSQAKFCEQCGAALNPDARFCRQCGHPVQAGAAQPSTVQQAPPPAAPTGEQVLGVIAGAQRRKGLLGRQTFNVVVTPGRLVFAEMTKQMMNDAVRQAAETAKREGRGILGRIAAQMGWLNLMVERYSQMPVERALAEQPGNFFILNSHIRKVRIDEKEDDDSGRTSYYLIIEAASGKYQFELTAGKPGEARQLLRQTLGAAVR